MVPIPTLWLPMLLSAVFVFFASFLIHMVLGYHRADWRKVPAEDDFMDAVRKFNIPAGDYMAPCGEGPRSMKDPAFMEKMKRGPVMIMTIFPPRQNGFGMQLLQWFVYCLLVSLFCAYIAGRAVGPGTDYLHVFRFAGAVAFACYAVAQFQNSIWYRRSWATTLRHTFDSLIYAGLTAGAFGWLWPK